MDVRKLLKLLLVFWLTISTGYGQNSIGFNLVVKHDQALPNAMHYKEIYLQQIKALDSLNRFTKGDKQVFTADIISSMRYLHDGKLDSALSLCYQQYYSDRLLDVNDSIILHRQIAAIYASLGDNIVSKKHLLRSFFLIDKCGYELQTISTDLARSYFLSGDADSAEYYLRYPLKRTIDPFGVYMNLATYYDEVATIRNMDSVEYYCRAALALQSTCSECNNDLTYIHLGLGNVKKEQGDLDSAVYYYRRILNEFTGYNDWYPCIQANIRLVEVFKEQEKIDSCEFYMNDLFVGLGFDHQARADLNYFKYEFYSEIGKPQVAMDYLHQSIEYRDSLILEKDEAIDELSTLNISQFKVIEDNLKIKETNLRLAKSRNFAFILALLFLLIIGWGIIVYYRQKIRRKKEMINSVRKRSKAKIETLEENKKQLKSDLKSVTIDLNKLASNLTLKQSFFTEHRDKLKAIIHSNSENIIPELKRYMVELKALESIDNNINVLQADIDRINNRLETSLKAHFPDLTENDIQVCALHLLKLSTKEIAAIRGVTPKSIQVARYRIKKKMKLSPEQDIVPFIELNFLT